MPSAFIKKGNSICTKAVILLREYQDNHASRQDEVRWQRHIANLIESLASGRISESGEELQLIISGIPNSFNQLPYAYLGYPFADMFVKEKMQPLEMEARKWLADYLTQGETNIEVPKPTKPNFLLQDNSWMNMHILGLFTAAIGIAAVALAFVLMSGIALAAVVIIGSVTACAGVGMFFINTCKKSNVSLPHSPANVMGL